MKKLLVGIGLVVVLLVAVVGYLFVNINSVAKDGVELAGSDVLGVEVTVESVNISFLDGQGTIKGLTVANPPGYEMPHAITVDELSVNIDPRSIGSDKIHIEKILIEGPAITYEGSLKDSNIKKLQEAAESRTGSAGESSSETGSDSTNLQIDLLKISNAKIGVHLSLLSEPLSMVMPSLELTDVGKDSSADAAEVVRQVLKALNKELLPLIQANMGDVGEKIKEAGKKLGDELGEKLGSKLKGLFK